MTINSGTVTYQFADYFEARDWMLYIMLVEFERPFKSPVTLDSLWPPKLILVRNELSDDVLAELEDTLGAWKTPQLYNRVEMLECPDHLK